MSGNQDKKDSPIIFIKFHGKGGRNTSGKLSFMDIIKERLALTESDYFNTSQTDVLDSPEKVLLIKQAAQRGDAESQRHLGKMYFYGHKVRKDYAKAVKWFVKAANQGDAEAQCRLAAICYNGKIVEQDFYKARCWYLKAAEQGDVGAQFSIGLMYELGEGVEQDYKTAACSGMVHEGCQSR